VLITAMEAEEELRNINTPKKTCARTLRNLSKCAGFAVGSEETEKVKEPLYLKRARRKNVEQQENELLECRERESGERERSRMAEEVQQRLYQKGSGEFRACRRFFRLRPMVPRSCGGAGNESHSTSSHVHQLTTSQPIVGFKQSDDERPTPRPQDSVDCNLCLARIWNFGRGAQCSRRPRLPHCLCRQHLKEQLAHGLSHGWITGAVPVQKAKAFAMASEISPCGRLHAQMRFRTSPNSCSAFAPFLPKKSEEHLRSATTASYIPLLSEITCVTILEGLTQAEIFRAGSTCSALHAAAKEQRLFQLLDMRPVGIEASTRGRKRFMSGNAITHAMIDFVCQPRFAACRGVDLRSCYIGEFEGGNKTFLHAVARFCPRANILLLASVMPANFWSPLESHLSTGMERRFREVWLTRPLILRFHGRAYMLLETGCKTVNFTPSSVHRQAYRYDDDDVQMWVREQFNFSSTETSL